MAGVSHHLTLGSPLNCKEIKSVDPKGYQSWIFIGRTEAEAEAPVLWPHDTKSRLIGKDPDARKDWGQQEEKGAIEDEMVGWNHWFNAHEFQQTLWHSEEQGSLACCSPWGRKESYITERLNHKSSFHIFPFSCQWDPLFRVIAFLEIKRYLVCLSEREKHFSVAEKLLIVRF